MTSLRGDAAKPAARTGQDVADLPLVMDGLNVSDLNDSYVNDIKAGGVHAIHKSVSLNLVALGGVLSFIDRREDVVHARTVAQIREARRQGRIAVVFGMQDSNDIEAVIQKSLRDTLGSIASAVRAGYEGGVRIQGIAYNLLNAFGGGCLDPRAGLSRAGRRLVESIHKTKIVLDVGGHTGEQTSLDALAISSGVPVICSHTNMAGLNPNIRATTDRVLEGVARTGGVIGVTAISDFIKRSPESARRDGPRTPQASLDDMLDQFDYVRKLVGADHVGLGSDFTTGRESAFVMKDLAENMAFPPDSLSEGPLQYVKDFENISQLPNLRRGLERRGWSAADITKALGENWLRVYRQVWGA